jgi:hypothetical protein
VNAMNARNGLKRMSPSIDTVFKLLTKEHASSVGATVPREHAGANDRLVQSKEFGSKQPKNQSPEDVSTWNTHGFLKGNGDCDLRSGQPIPSFVGLTQRLTQDQRGQSPLPKTTPRSFPAFPAVTAFLPI